MSRIAIIDTSIDANYIGGKIIEHISLCNDSNNGDSGGVNHGSLCAMVLDYCTSDYELLNIQIYKDSNEGTFTDIELLREALRLCVTHNIDIVSLSAVSSILSDSNYLYDIICELARNTVIISALDNARFITVPSSYPNVLGVSSDNANILSPGELAYINNDPLGVNVYANCNFAFMRKLQCKPSNSFAVPVVAAYVNGLLNQEYSIERIERLLREISPYRISQEDKYLYLSGWQKGEEIPVIFLCDKSIEVCLLINDLYNKYYVQATVLTLVDIPYDIRVKKIENIENIQEDICFMEYHYKTDLIFIVGKENMLEKIQKAVEIDIILIGQGDERTCIKYENECELVPRPQVSDRIYEILTE